METKGGERCFRCVCKQTNSKFDPFLKILDLADIGLNIYKYLATKYAQVAGVAPQTTAAGLDVFILQNSRNEDIQSASYIKSLDTNKINCPKCKRILTRAKRLIETIPAVNKGSIIGICDHCRKRAEPRTSCEVCEKIVRKFVSSEIKRNQTRPLRIDRSQSDLNLKYVKYGPDRSDATAPGFSSTETKWYERGPGIRKQFEQKLIPCLVKSQHEGGVPDDEIRKHFQNAALIRSRSETFIDAITGLTEEILDNTFHYYFPKGDEHRQPMHDGVMETIYYDKYGKPVHGRGMPEVFYDEHGHPIQGRGMPEVYYDERGQPIQGIGMPEVYFDEHGQPIQGRGMPEVYYDEQGRPIGGRDMPEVYYDKHGQPIPDRGMPRVFYDEHGRLITGRGMPEVYYDKNGQPIQGRDMPEVHYDKHGQPIQGRGMPEVYYDKHGQPIEGRLMPEAYYDKHGKPIQVSGVPEIYYDKHGEKIERRRMPEVLYDKHGQPIQGRGMPEVYYDKHGQPIPGRGMPEVYYDKHGQPIPGRGMPEVYYVKHGQPIRGRDIPEVYYDKNGQAIRGRGMPEVYYDKHGQPIPGRGMPEVYYDKIGHPIQGRRMPEVIYDKHGQPIQGRGVPEVYYDKHGQPIQGKRMPEVIYDKHGQPIQGRGVPEVHSDEEGLPIQERRKAEVFYDKHGQPVPAGRSHKDFDKHGKPITRARSLEVYYDKQGWPVQAGRKAHDKHGQPIAKAKSSEFYDKSREERPPELYYDKDGRPISRGLPPGAYYDEHGKSTHGGKSKGTAHKALYSSTETPETRVQGRGKSAGGSELDKSKRQIEKDAESARKLERPISGGTEKSQLPSRSDKAKSARSKEESAYESKRSEGKETVPKAKDTKAPTKVVPRTLPAGKSSAEKKKVSKVVGAGGKDAVAPAKDVLKSKQEAVHAAGKSSAEKEKIPKATGAGAKGTVAPAKDVVSKVPQGKQESVQASGKSLVEKEKLSKATEAGVKDIKSPAKVVPSKASQSKQESIPATSKSGAQKEKSSKATGMDAKDTAAPVKDANKKGTQTKQDAMQAAGKSGAEKEKVTKAIGSGVKDQKQKSTGGPKQASEEEKSKTKRLEETKQKELADKKPESKDLKKEKASGDGSKVRTSETPATGKQKVDIDFDNKIKDARRIKEEQIKQQKEEEKQKIAKQKADAEALSMKKEAALAEKALIEQHKQKLKEEQLKKANEEKIQKFKNNLKTIPPIPQAIIPTNKPDQIIRPDKAEDAKQQIFKIDEKMVSTVGRLDNQKTFDKPNVELNLRAIQLQKPSLDDIVAKVVTVKPRDKTPPIKTDKELERLGRVHRLHERAGKEDDLCDICYYSELQYQLEEITRRKQMKGRKNAIVGNNIKTVKDITKDMNVDEEEKAPTLFKTKFTIESLGVYQKDPEPPSDVEPQSKQIQTDLQQKGVIKYQLSDRSFIEKGWTLLPTEKVVRKMNVYRMRPAHPEFDWFERNKNKRCMEYDTGEKLAEFTDDGRGRWFYRNGRVALEYYDAEGGHFINESFETRNLGLVFDSTLQFEKHIDTKIDTNAQHRVLVFSSGEPDERGRTHPYTVLGSFDHMGSGVVFDHGGKIRLKYNQSEGVVLDRSLGPVSHWKWHSLNDPPVLQQVMIDTQLPHKDPEILKMGDQTETERPDNEDMLAIEFDNFIKEKSKKLTQKFKPFQIKMKALKINEHFSLRILDQASVYLIFRDGTTNLKLNMGMIIDHKEIVDTDTAEMGDVANNIEKLPARTDSIAAIQASIDNAQQEARLKLERDRRLCPPVARCSVDQLRAAASHPLRRPIHPAPSSGTTSRKPSRCNIYYNTRII